MDGRERRLTVLAAAVSGSDRLRDKLGHGEALRAVDRCLKRMQRAIEGFRGSVAKAAGDEIVALFETTEDACEAAVEMQQRVHGLPPVCGVKLAIRTVFVDAASSADPENTARRLLDLAEPEQILTSSRSAELLPRALRESTSRVPALSVTGEDGVQTVIEIAWHGRDMPSANLAAPAAAPAPVPAAANPASAGARLCVRYRGRSYLLDEQTPVLTFGRDPASDVVIEDRKASRRHARIERRGERYFLVDSSTNGSYLTLGGEPELLLHREEALLHGSGAIGFGISVGEMPTEQARFEYL